MIVAFSGGKDSTALALRLAELGEPIKLLFTPTGDELPAVREHIDRVAALTGAELIIPPNRSLYDWIEFYNALPNNRQRWCTRLIKIQPCIAWFKRHPGESLAIGLRADEEAREGLYSSLIKSVFPLRDWGWGVREVVDYNLYRGVVVPKRTDCALCPYQRISEWRDLWRDHPEAFSRGVALEKKTGHTFRSPSRDKWPASLEELAGEFKRGRKIRGYRDTEAPCRVCSL